MYKTGSLLIRDYTTRIRGHSMELKKLYSRLELQYNLFSFRVVDPWNDLSKSVVTADPVDCFRFQLVKHYVHLGASDSCYNQPHLKNCIDFD